jgi:hypothetical protein
MWGIHLISVLMPLLQSYISRCTNIKQSTKMFVYFATRLIGYSCTIIDEYYEHYVIRAKSGEAVVVVNFN